MLAIAVMSGMYVLIKLAGEREIHIVESLFWRQLPTIPFVLIWLLLKGQWPRLRTKRLGAHARRAMYGMVGMSLNFAAVTLLPLAEATALNFTTVFWAVILSAVILKENVGYWRWGAVLIGFVGVLAIAKPGAGGISLSGASVALAGAFMIALISIQIRNLSISEEPFLIVFYFSVFTAPVFALVLPFVATPHDVGDWCILFGLALLGLFGQLVLTASLRFAPVSTVIIMDYSGLIWATLFGWIVFEQLPTPATWVGAPLIIGAALLVAWREHQKTSA
nr:DMT family transporter [Eilatimonas milleporae]